MWRPAQSFPQTPNDLSLFVAQAWHELLGLRTPDTFQARVLDLPMLLREIAHVAQLSMNDDRWTAYLPMIADELQENGQSETVYLSSNPKLRASVDTLIKTIHSRTETPRIVHERALVALGLFGSVRRWREHALLLATGAGKEKAALLHRLSTLATHVLSRGLESESLEAISAQTCCDKPEFLVDKITGCLTDEDRAFLCVVALGGTHADLASLITNSKFSRAGTGAGIRRDDISRQWQTSHARKFFVKARYSASSKRIAAETCLQDISTLLNVQNLYHNSGCFHANSRILLYEDGNDTPSELEVNLANQFGLFPRSKYRKLSRETYAIVGRRLNGRIANALECHALALSADDPKTAMINLWTALETISGSIDGKNVGASVAKRIAPVIAHRRVDKITTYLALSVLSTLKDAAASIKRDLFPNSNEQHISPDDILSALTGRRGNAPIMHLFAQCTSSPLLNNRLFVTWKQFHDPKALASSMTRSRQRIEWQIARIYRARNLLVHRGEQSTHIWRLLRNAQYYVSAAISRVLHDLRDQQSWNVDTSLEHQMQRYNYVHEQLARDAGKGLVYSDLLMRLTSRDSNPIWGDAD